MKGRTYIFDSDDLNPQDPYQAKFRKFCDEKVLPIFQNDEVLKEKYLDKEDPKLSGPLMYTNDHLGRPLIMVSKEFKKNHPDLVKKIEELIKEELQS